MSAVCPAPSRKAREGAHPHPFTANVSQRGVYSPQMMATRREVAHPQLFRSMLKDKPALYFPR